MPCRAELQRETKRVEPVDPPGAPEPACALVTSDGQPYSAHQAERYEWYQQVVALHQQGMKTKEIAKRVGLGTRTIQRWLTQEEYVETNYHHRHRSRFDAYEAYVLRRWDEGCHNIAVKRDYHGILTEECVCKEGAEHAGDQLELLSFSGSEPDHTGFPRADGKRTEVSEYH